VTHRLSVFAVIDDARTIRLLPKVIQRDRLTVITDVAEALELAQAKQPDVAIIDISLGAGAGLALIHHIKSLAPSTIVIALARPTALEAGANAISLGGAVLLIQPVEGDEIATVLEDVRARRAEQLQRAELERDAMIQARTAGWITRIVEQAGAKDRATAARRIARVFMEATAAVGAAMYLGGHGQASQLTMLAASVGELTNAPSAGTEEEIFRFAAEAGLDPVALCTREIAVGHLLLQPAKNASSRALAGDTLFLLVAQATTTLALVLECERSSDGGAIKDPSSSAYSFAYYVDVAGREIDKAKRFGRRFAIVTVNLYDNESSELKGDDELGWEMHKTADPATVADQLLAAARETAVVARVDEQEFQLLLPETDGLGAQACRRRIVSRLANTASMASVAVGAAIFPHDGRDLSQLLRMARRRAEASRTSPAHRVNGEVRRLDKVLESLLVAEQLGHDVSRIRSLRLLMADAVTLVTSVVSEVVRGGATFIVVAQHSDLSLSAAIRAAIPADRTDVTLHAIDVRDDPGSEAIEALSVVGEHGAYSLLARHAQGELTGTHSSDPLIADLVADRIGRAGGMRVLS